MSCLFCDKGKETASYRLGGDKCEKYNKRNLSPLICVFCLRDEEKRELFFKEVRKKW